MPPQQNCLPRTQNVTLPSTFKIEPHPQTIMRQLLRLLFTTLLTCSLLASFCVQADSLSAQLPDIGKAGSRVLSPRAEQQLGQEFMRSVRNSLKLLDDRPTTAYLQGLADRLASSLQEEHAPITVFLVNDPSINAFAGPGGYIGVHTGLLLSANTEGELASVLAHEIAHVTQRHLVRAFQDSQRMSLPTMGAIIAAMVLGGSNPEVGEAVLATAVANSAQQQLTHSRGNEQEADNIGLDMLVNANFSPHDMVAFFEVLQNKQKLTEFSAPEFLRTHPLTLGRIADASNRAAQYGAQRFSDNAYFHLIQARIAALTQRPLPGMQTSATLVANSTNESIAPQYFQALHAAEHGNFTKARKILSRLTKTNEHPTLFQYSAAQVELMADRPQKAHDILKQTLELFPGNVSLIELYAQSLLRLQRAEPALLVLKTTLRKYPEQFHLYQLYGQAATALGQKAEAYRALAEFQYGQGNFHQAIDHLEQALKTPNLATYDRLSLQARQDAMKTEVRLKEPPVTHEEGK